MARDLKKGCTGNDVLELQKKLQAVGYYLDGSLDGIFANVTDRAVRAFQKANGLTVDGIYGPKTRAALEAKLDAIRGNKKNKVKGKKTGLGGVVSVEMGRWGGHKFVISSNLIYSFKTLQIKGASEMENDKDDKEGYVKRKCAKPTEVTFSLNLNAYAGCDVRALSTAFVESARAGKTDYFYVGGKKLTPCKLMLTDCTAKDVEIARNGQWTKAEVSLTMKQCSKNESTNTAAPNPGGSASNGSQKAGVKSSTPVTSSNYTAKSSSSVGKLQTQAKSVKSATTTKDRVKTACATVRKTTKAAKKASAQKVRTVSA